MLIREKNEMVYNLIRDYSTLTLENGMAEQERSYTVNSANNVDRKWYQYKTETVLENKNHKIRYDFNARKNHRIQARRPDLRTVKKKMPNYGFDYASRT